MIDHVRLTGALLAATFMAQFAAFARGHDRRSVARPADWPARLFLLETALLYGSWCVAGVLLMLRRTALFHETAIVVGQAAAPRGAGLALFLAANGLLWWTRRALGKSLSLAGTPPVPDGALVTRGPYAAVRHPLYLASLLVASGLALIVGSWLFLVPMAAIALTLPSLIAIEEGRLAARYGDAFREYARRTRRLLPGIW
jgi:protein-S-isoprenylcysteine O-methyltransferase Ste14